MRQMLTPQIPRSARAETKPHSAGSGTAVLAEVAVTDKLMSSMRQLAVFIEAPLPPEPNISKVTAELAELVSEPPVKFTAFSNCQLVPDVGVMEAVPIAVVKLSMLEKKVIVVGPVVVLLVPREIELSMISKSLREVNVTAKKVLLVDNAPFFAAAPKFSLPEALVYPVEALVVVSSVVVPLSLF